jgi:type IV pilus assembly protein PilV
MSVRAGTPPSSLKSAGYFLLELLISLTLFAIGILGIVALQAIFIRDNTQAEYRLNASFLAGVLIAQMWADDDRSPDSLLNNYQTGGAEYASWFDDKDDTDVDSVLELLPGAEANPPTVTVTVVNGPAPPATAKALIDIAVKWQMPGESDVHQHVATTVIK